MHAFISAFRVEKLKLKHSLLLQVSILIPVGYIALELVGALQRQSLGIEAGVNFWSAITESFSRNWLFLLYPLLLTLQTALLGDMEYRNNTWQLIFCQPKKRSLILAAKQLMAVVIPFISLLCMFAGMLLFGFILKYLKPEFHVDNNIPFAEIGWTFLAPFLISIFVISIQTWISLNWGNFIVSCSTGITCMLVALFLFDHEYSRFFPWDMPGLGFYRLIHNEPVQGILLLNLALAGVTFLISNYCLSKKQID